MPEYLPVEIKIWINESAHPKRTTELEWISITTSDKENKLLRVGTTKSLVLHFQVGKNHQESTKKFRHFIQELKLRRLKKY